MHSRWVLRIKDSWEFRICLLPATHVMFHAHNFRTNELDVAYRVEWNFWDLKCFMLRYSSENELTHNIKYSFKLSVEFHARIHAAAPCVVWTVTVTMVNFLNGRVTALFAVEIQFFPQRSRLSQLIELVGFLGILSIIRKHSELRVQPTIGEK